MYVDDRRIIDWTDDNKKYGPVLKGGKIGFRQMKWTHFRYANFKVWNLSRRTNWSKYLSWQPIMAVWKIRWKLS